MSYAFLTESPDDIKNISWSNWNFPKRQFCSCRFRCCDRRVCTGRRSGI